MKNWLAFPALINRLRRPRFGEAAPASGVFPKDFWGIV
jgi:hypothetical protein